MEMGLEVGECHLHKHNVASDDGGSALPDPLRRMGGIGAIAHNSA
jgi:hypothetical protein